MALAPPKVFFQLWQTPPPIVPKHILNQAHSSVANWTVGLCALHTMNNKAEKGETNLDTKRPASPLTGPPYSLQWEICLMILTSCPLHYSKWVSLGSLSWSASPRTFFASSPASYRLVPIGTQNIKSCKFPCSFLVPSFWGPAQLWELTLFLVIPCLSFCFLFFVFALVLPWLETGSPFHRAVLLVWYLQSLLPWHSLTIPQTASVYEAGNVSLLSDASIKGL